jgi:tight adherence protein B
VATIAGGREWGARRRAAAELAAARHAATALRTIVAELRAGAHPVLAAEAAAETVPELSGELQALAGAAHLDGELRAPALPELARAWTLARRFGLPMADVLDAARRDVESGISFGRRMRARMAGPRASAAVLTGLPAACVLLGEAVGAAPLHVLTATTAGQLLLVAGAFLLWAGTAWSRALTGRVRFR